MISTTPSLVLHPTIPMARFGLNDFGENRYRVIWAPSRTITLTGRGNTITVPMYIGQQALELVGEFWILEAWKSAYDATGMTAKQWNRDPEMLNTGPYPGRGEYYRCETFAVQPNIGMVEKLISWIEAGKHRRPIENVLAIEENLKQQAKQRSDKQDDMIRSRMLQWPAQAVVGARFKKNPKTTPLMRTAEEAGLPRAGATIARRSRQGYNVTVTEDAIIPA